MPSEPEIAAIVAQFEVEGAFRKATPMGSGHIHDTFCVELAGNENSTSVILQRINRDVFGDTAALMENMERVTAHLAKSLAGEPEAERRSLRLIDARSGATWLTDGLGNDWRMMEKVERARTFDAVESIEQAYEAAKAFGNFQFAISSLPAPRLNEILPGFHDTAKRFEQLSYAVKEDAIGLASGCRCEIEFATARKHLCEVILKSGVPERVTHNDTKLNNVLFDEATGEGLCVIDLDTVMPGFAPHDFGDLVRTAASTAAEDEPDSGKVRLRLDLFDALLRGYLDATRELLTDEEKHLLVDAAKAITFEQGIRFLADYLAGDTYYKTHRKGQNLDRCRTQFHLLREMERHEPALRKRAAELAFWSGGNGMPRVTR